MDHSPEIRKVPPLALYGLVQILEIDQSWKKLMSIVPQSGDETLFKYTYDHVKSIEDASVYQKRPCAEIFLEEWGTSGERRPTLKVLLNLLQKADLYRAADFVAIQLLQASTPTRPTKGPAANVDVSEKNIQTILDSRLEEIKHRNQSDLNDNHHQIHSSSTSNETKPSSAADVGLLPSIHQKIETCSVENESIPELNSEICHNLQTANSNENNNLSKFDCLFKEYCDVKHIPFVELQECTNNFCDIPFSSEDESKGNKLGTGAFGSVYYGVLSFTKVAVKRLKNDAVGVRKQFENEIEALAQYQHENLLPLLRYSCDGPSYCLVYAYMCNGSLQDMLACKISSFVLPWEERLNIAFGTAKGILYLHSAFEKPLIHRDIKSANILLDDKLVPKLGDFGLVHLGPSGQPGQSIAHTTTVFGTSAYMAREAFWGDISVKLDTFSFGVVLLELLTSLLPYDESRESRDLITHVEDSCENSVEPLLDRRAGTWLARDEKNVADSLYLLALDCLKERRQSRPDMKKVVEDLSDLIRSL